MNYIIIYIIREDSLFDLRIELGVDYGVKGS